ncbi:secondary thiamine-phosphate synthase enzyme YjbQ [Halocella sp. SP3-1]|uniref:secondary thiamine-phosphate synthase enzyme YjbQ n=1 Tax=Halocella sp. SP3-1 TaxID=2382161 RepID=UPI000F74C0C7|nr:secondary thiamine-phosphate synthase enzyme YjbQ [Halocella sp. SP3-1]AZO96581.1 YjbQ family protein [Halocella sp. SP3-1]
MIEEVKIRTKNHVEFIDITTIVRDIVSKDEVNDGIVVIYVPHTTAAVTINENADPDVVKDMTKEINEIVPFDDDYFHLEGNSAAHIKGSLIGSSETIIIENGALVLGRWQGIYFCEFDGPRKRKLYIKIISN